MATINPFDLLDGDFGDPSEFLAAAEQKAADKPKKIVHAVPAKIPTKPPPPSPAVKETKSDGGVRGGRGGASRGSVRGRGSFNRDSNSNEINYSTSNGNGGFKPLEDGKSKVSDRRIAGDRPRGTGAFRGGRRGGLTNGDAVDGERPRRAFERRSGTGRGYEVKREGSGRGNWGTSTDEISIGNEDPAPEVAKEAVSDKPLAEEGATEAPKATEEEKEPEPVDKEMTLEEYEKVREEKRKGLLSSKTEERKVDVDKEFKSMHPLSSKKSNGEIFIKLGSEKDKKKETEKDEKAKKSVSINEFLKPAEGERYNGYRGRGRGRGAQGGFGAHVRDVAAPKIEDPGQFPSLGGK